jgi:hypothetical protein
MVRVKPEFLVKLANKNEERNEERPSGINPDGLFYILAMNSHF